MVRCRVEVDAPEARVVVVRDAIMPRRVCAEVSVRRAFVARRAGQRLRPPVGQRARRSSQREQCNNDDENPSHLSPFST